MPTDAVSAVLQTGAQGGMQATAANTSCHETERARVHVASEFGVCAHEPCLQRVLDSQLGCMRHFVAAQSSTRSNDTRSRHWCVAALRAAEHTAWPTDRDGGARKVCRVRLPADAGQLVATGHSKEFAPASQLTDGSGRSREHRRKRSPCGTFCATGRRSTIGWKRTATAGLAGCARMPAYNVVLVSGGDHPLPLYPVS